MPELPEVETIRRDLHRKVKDKEIKFVTVNTPKIVKEPPISEFCTQIEGKVFKNINRRGKYLVSRESYLVKKKEVRSLNPELF